MAAEIIQCAETFSNFTYSCIPGVEDGTFNVGSVLNNILNGHCTNSISQVFTTCIPSSFFNLYAGRLACYSSSEAFWNCRPGTVAHLSHAPFKCLLLSYVTFFFNEAITFLEGKEKLKAIGVTQGLRYIENNYCLPTCEKYDYMLLGPNEYPKEIARYQVGLVHRAVGPAMVAASLAIPGSTFAGAAVSGALGALGSQYHNYLLQTIHSFEQQNLRNLDQKERHGNCSLSHRTAKLFTPPPPPVKQETSYFSSFFEKAEIDEPPTSSNLETAMEVTQLFFDGVSIVGSQTYRFTSNLVANPLRAIYKSLAYTIRFCFNAIFYPEQRTLSDLDHIRNKNVTGNNVYSFIKANTQNIQDDPEYNNLDSSNNQEVTDEAARTVNSVIEEINQVNLNEFSGNDAIGSYF